jgi:hypothetical protein
MIHFIDRIIIREKITLIFYCAYQSIEKKKQLVNIIVSEIHLKKWWNRFEWANTTPVIPEVYKEGDEVKAKTGYVEDLTLNSSKYFEAGCSYFFPVKSGQRIFIITKNGVGKNRAISQGLFRPGDIIYINLGCKIDKKSAVAEALSKKCEYSSSLYTYTKYLF